MQFSATQIAEIIKGRIEGNAAVTVSTFGKIEEAKQGELSFLANPKYEEYLYSTEASIIIINESLQLKKMLKLEMTIQVPHVWDEVVEAAPDVCYHQRLT